MKTTFTTAVFLLALLASAQTSQAQSISLDAGDYFNDYRLYLADPDTTDWYIVWLMDDGSVIEEGPFLTEQGAQDRLVWYFLGGYERSNDAVVVQLTMPPQWEYFATFDTASEAYDMRDFFAGLGLLTDVRAVLDYSRLAQQSYRPGIRLTAEMLTPNRFDR